jgi:hypothetical protein
LLRELALLRLQHCVDFRITEEVRGRFHIAHGDAQLELDSPHRHSIGTAGDERVQAEEEIIKPLVGPVIDLGLPGPRSRVTFGVTLSPTILKERTELLDDAPDVSLTLPVGARDRGSIRVREVGVE